MDTLLIGLRREEKSPAPNGIQTQVFCVMRRVFYVCATTAAQQVKDVKLDAKVRTVLSGAEFSFCSTWVTKISVPVSTGCRTQGP